MNKRNNKKTGDLGESIAATYLQQRGYKIVDRNYRKPWAEIDIIAQKSATVHFVEVKTVSYETKAALENGKHNSWRPEELVHSRKLHQIGKGAETWLSEQGYTGNWQIDVVAVKVVPRETYASVKLIPNVIVE